MDPASRILGAEEGCPSSLCLREAERGQVWGPREGFRQPRAQERHCFIHSFMSCWQDLPSARDTNHRQARGSQCREKA